MPDTNNLSIADARLYDEEQRIVMHCGNCDVEIPVDEKRCGACQMVADAYSRRLFRLKCEYNALLSHARAQIADFEVGE